ncbi:MAG TPA: polysaccharide biosynthesis protein [Candidatus Sericytochromatia bacterium]
MARFSPNVIYWIKTLSKFISVQLIVQALGAASGIFLVRTLDQTQYAYYTIALTMQTTMSLLADMGISVGLSAIGGKVWQDKYRFGQLINTAMQLRYSLAGISVIVVTPILIWMLIKNGASISYGILILIVVLVGLNFQLTTDILGVVPRLHSQIRRVQNLELFSAVIRLVLLGFAYLTFLDAAVAIGIVSIGLGVQRFILGRWVTDSIETKALINLEDRNFISAKVKALAPNAIFFCIQGQLSIWLISLFGTTENIAEIGALGRIAIIFSIINPIMKTIVSPSFARCQSKGVLRRRYFQIISLFFLFLAAIGILAVLFHRTILGLLGNQYINLKTEFFLLLISASLNSIIQIIAYLNATKAWVQYAWIEIIIRIGLQIILLLVVDISTVKGILLFGIFSQLSPLAVSLLRSYLGFKNYEYSH